MEKIPFSTQGESLEHWIEHPSVIINIPFAKLQDLDMLPDNIHA